MYLPFFWAWWVKISSLAMRLSIELWGLWAVEVVCLADVFPDVKSPITKDYTMRCANFLLESGDRTCTHRTSLDIILY
ncbi:MULTISPECIES: hypothetical protein [unclassified Microcoleus]|uniref:hypothetical protein n=1 Tax=unclassified Microcoleus TaxID=2642155 RepID=UPI001D7B081A|nr:MULTISPECIES: hypothetical protein [unclassified Microcoleus]TAE66551.1 MAG: hypothetical protein EAZ86_19820 [Oscillatoriales cyanobacterium]MCC3491451.1 hypothetical protein [Microcoleus sp. PH2017_16_JOR_D_A]MCC3571819.1 hypothetical protein [Microcoleus sp. PH2017_34_RAT_O_A]MCC3586268.1 hypothetical protein [Microcoleus sp. PH2017_30_WIL_O_A]TAH27611.1 MAG: hypothetical protein EAZ10_07970 [Oscillatoriales cyanobacterium]